MGKKGSFRAKQGLQLKQACFLAIKEKTQGEKTQNSRKKLKTQEQNSNFRHLRVEKLKWILEWNVSLPVLLKEKTMENIKKAQLILTIWIEAKTQAKPY